MIFQKILLDHITKMEEALQDLRAIMEGSAGNFSDVLGIAQILRFLVIGLESMLRAAIDEKERR